MARPCEFYLPTVGTLPRPLFFLKKIITEDLFIVFQRERKEVGWGRGGEYDRETLIGCLLYAP